MIIIGGDLDLDGAIVLLDEDGQYLDHTRFRAIPHNSPGVLKRRMDCTALDCRLFALLPANEDMIAFLEWPGIISSNGMLRSASQHRTLGNIEAVLACFRVETQYVNVKDWKRNFGLIGKPKKAAIPIANKLCGTTVSLVKDTSVAEAALIARYGMRIAKAQEVKC